MAVKPAEVEEVTQRIDEDLATDLKQHPSRIRRWFTSNVLQRSLSYLVGFTKDKRAKTITVSEGGAVYTKNAGGTVAIAKVIPTTSVDVVETLFPDLVGRTEIVDVSKEGIPAKEPYYMVAKITLLPNETIKIPVPRINMDRNFYLKITTYQTGTGKITLQSNSNNTYNDWVDITSPVTTGASKIILEGGADGGNIYIAYIQFFDSKDDFVVYDEREVNEALTTTKAYTFNLSYQTLVVPKSHITMYCCSVYVSEATGSYDISVKLRGTNRTVIDAVILSGLTTTGWVHIKIPIMQILDGYIDVTFRNITDSVTVKTVRLTAKDLKRPFTWRNPEYNEYTASNTSTTLTSYTLLDSKNAVKLSNNTVEVTIATGGGQVVIKADDKEVLNVTASGTYTIPDLEYVNQLTAEIKGDGTNASSVTFKTYKWDGDYILV